MVFCKILDMYERKGMGDALNAIKEKRTGWKRRKWDS
jgi:hypothetical protein